MLSGDALQYYYSQRQFNIDKRRAEEDYQRQRERSIADFNRSQNDSLQEFNLSRALQIRQYEIQRADQQFDFEYNRRIKRWQFQIGLDDMEWQFRKERNRRTELFYEQIWPLFVTEAEARAKMTTQLNGATLTEFNKLMAAFVNGYNQYWDSVSNAQKGTGTGTGGGSSSTRPSGLSGAVRTHAIGGYTMEGLAYLHSNEFVLSPDSTKAAENLAKGKLSQETIIEMMSGGGKGFEYNDNRQFSRGLTADEKIEIKQWLQQLFAEAYR